MSKAEFHNRLRCLFNIDGDRVADQLSEREQLAFMRDPVEFFIRCDDAKADAIWREIERNHNAKAA